ncbi:hypothetical protein T4C_5779 [Trichinella pseudospiralis]|uniref:Uncharacterized protein n=1 Tax=Trichinella pseudospiralis TaxID=6337 RepID=A0A0V1KF28_TRIPS|nr:hypothetical protein T4C_5779 [Trichinella pseudospiralis]
MSLFTKPPILNANINIMLTMLREKLNLSNQYTLTLLFSAVVLDVVAADADADAAAAAVAAGCF